MSDISKITVVNIKPIKSTTSVKGTLVLCSNNLYYAILIMQPSRNPWFIKGIPSTRSGKSTIDINTEIFSMRCRGNEPDVQVGIDVLMQALNGEEVSHDKIVY